MTDKCPKCNHEIYVTHSDNTCNFFQFTEEMKKKDFTAVSESPYVEELKNNNIEVAQFRWNITPNSRIAGYVEYSYIPRWAVNVLNMWDENTFAGLTLTEFLDKMRPQDVPAYTSTEETSQTS